MLTATSNGGSSSCFLLWDFFLCFLKQNPCNNSSILPNLCKGKQFMVTVNIQFANKMIGYGYLKEKTVCILQGDIVIFVQKYWPLACLKCDNWVKKTYACVKLNWATTGTYCLMVKVIWFWTNRWTNSGIKDDTKNGIKWSVKM